MHCPVHDQGGRGFQPRPGRRHSSRANGHEIYGDEQTNALPAEHCLTGLETPDRSLLQVLRLNGNYLVKAMRQCRIFWLNTMSRSISDNLLTFSSCADSHDKHVEKSGLQSAASGTVARLRVIEPRFSTETAASKPSVALVDPLMHQ